MKKLQRPAKIIEHSKRWRFPCYVYVTMVCITWNTTSQLESWHIFKILVSMDCMGVFLLHMYKGGYYLETV